MKNITIHSDGGARGNPGPAGIGFVIADGENIIYEGRGYIGETTNNVAEYKGIREGLSWVLSQVVSSKKQVASDKNSQSRIQNSEKENLNEIPLSKRGQAESRGIPTEDRNWLSGVQQIDCFLDSELVVKQLRGEYKMKAEHLRILKQDVESVVTKLQEVGVSQITFNHVPRKENKRADALVNEAIDEVDEREK